MYVYNYRFLHFGVMRLNHFFGGACLMLSSLSFETLGSLKVSLQGSSAFKRTIWSLCSVSVRLSWSTSHCSEHTLLSGGTPHPQLTKLTEHAKSILWSLCSPLKVSLTLGPLVCTGTVRPGVTRLWKSSSVEWGELQSPLQKSQILEGDGETPRGLWGCCQMLFSSASGKV